MFESNERVTNVIDEEKIKFSPKNKYIGLYLFRGMHHADFINKSIRNSLPYVDTINQSIVTLVSLLILYYLYGLVLIIARKTFSY